MDRAEQGRRDQRRLREIGTAALEETPSGAFTLPRPSRTLTALTSSALALPGIAGSARADAPIEQATASSAFSYYKEDNLSPSRFSGTGSRERFEVYTGQMRFDIPTSERTDFGLDLLYEEMSGASPWYVTPRNGDTSDPVQVMSGATIEDRRVDVSADLDFYLDEGKDTFRGGFSMEKDYTSLNFGLGTERSFADKNTTLSISSGFSYDWIEPTDADIFQTRPSSEEKWSIDLFAGLSQILTRSSTVQATINYKHSDGYLSDPYKEIWAQDLNGNSELLADKRPGTKDQVSILLRYRHHIEPITASVHADYRLYTDSWSVTSHTFELAWYQSIPGLEWLTIVPSVRYYSQSKADFYEPLLTGGFQPKERSSDFRLSPYGAVSWKIKAEAEFKDVAQYDPPRWLEMIGFTGHLDLIASLSWERYWSDGDIALVDVKESDEAPGLVRFHVFAVGLSGRF